MYTPRLCGIRSEAVVHGCSVWIFVMQSCLEGTGHGKTTIPGSKLFISFASVFWAGARFRC